MVLLLGDEEDSLVVVVMMVAIETDVEWIGRYSNVTTSLPLSVFLHSVHYRLSNPSAAIFTATHGHSGWTQWQWEITSDDFMVDDFNIRHSSQRGYTLESFNGQWSRGPLNQYGVLQLNGCVPWKPCRSQCNLIQPLGQASLNRNGGEKNMLEIETWGSGWIV